jgi:hypothetical protein
MCPTGGGGRILRRYALQVWQIPVGHFDPYRELRLRNRRRPRTPLKSILVAGSTFHRGALKRRLFEEGLKQRRCEACGQGED